MLRDLGAAFNSGLGILRGGPDFCYKDIQNTSLRRKAQHGVPQRSVLGPICLTSTVFQLPGSSNITALITISPDTKLYAECPGSQHKDALQRIDKCARELRQWLTKNILLLNENKTEAITTVPLKMVVRDIGVCFDSHLDMSAQVSGTCRGARCHLFRIARIRASLTTAACETLGHSLVTSRLDYSIAVLYGITGRQMHRLEMVQRAGVRVVLQIKRNDRQQSISAGLRRLQCVPGKWLVSK